MWPQMTCTSAVQVRTGVLLPSELTAKLTEHVDRIDTDLALEYQVQQGLAAGAAKAQLCLAPLTAGHVLGPELHSNVAVVRLLQGFKAPAAAV